MSKRQSDGKEEVGGKDSEERVGLQQ